MKVSREELFGWCDGMLWMSPSRYRSTSPSGYKSKVQKEPRILFDLYLKYRQKITGKLILASLSAKSKYKEDFNARVEENKEDLQEAIKYINGPSRPSHIRIKRPPLTKEEVEEKRNRKNAQRKSYRREKKEMLEYRKLRLQKWFDEGMPMKKEGYHPERMKEQERYLDYMKTKNENPSMNATP